MHFDTASSLSLHARRATSQTVLKPQLNPRAEVGDFVHDQVNDQADDQAREHSVECKQSDYDPVVEVVLVPKHLVEVLAENSDDHRRHA